jgi:hypothetical protein
MAEEQSDSRIGKTFKELLFGRAVLPGDVFRMSSGWEILAGHINTLGGICDDCPEHGVDTAVLVRNIDWK